MPFQQGTQFREFRQGTRPMQIEDEIESMPGPKLRPVQVEHQDGEQHAPEHAGAELACSQCHPNGDTGEDVSGIQRVTQHVAEADDGEDGHQAERNQ